MRLQHHLALAFVIDAIIAGPLQIAHDANKKRTIPETHTLHERGMPHWEHTWQKKSKVPSEALLPMRIGLKQSNLHHGHNVLMDISNPKSANFGRHMSAEEVTDFFAPPRASVDTVVEWLTSAGIDIERITQSVNKQWIGFDASAAEAENLLYTDYFVYEHAETGTQDVACNKYHLPGHVQAHVDYVTPGIRLRSNHAEARKLGQESAAADLQKRGVQRQIIIGDPIPSQQLPLFNTMDCDVFVTNPCVLNQYGIPNGTKAAKGNELGIFESLNDHYSKADLDLFWSTRFPEIPSGTYPEERLINGAIGAAQTPDQVGGESNLDFQSAWPIIWPQKAVLFQTDDQDTELRQRNETSPYVGFWNTFYDAIDGSYCSYSAYGQTGNCVKPECLDPAYPNPAEGGYKGALQCGVFKPTNVISISYGYIESELPAYYWKRQCDEIMKLGLQGVTVVMSSGDFGVGTFPSADRSGCAGPDDRVFLPLFGATCPYVLAVGSTELVNATSSATQRTFTERATSWFGSGGGFSNYFDAPDYQKEAIESYFGKVSLSFKGYTDPGTNFSNVGDGVYKLGGRGFPDVAAIGFNFLHLSNNTWFPASGTSLSAPLWAAMLTRVNEERIAAGKKSVGFVNPTLYQHPEVFNDITEGSNPNCKSTGFLAASGWDPVTGLGTPKFPELLSLLTSLP